ncbi:hypothetical protein ABK040_015883 [Willaertia magna]
MPNNNNSSSTIIDNNNNNNNNNVLNNNNFESNYTIISDSKYQQYPLLKNDALDNNKNSENHAKTFTIGEETQEYNFPRWSIQNHIGKFHLLKSNDLLEQHLQALKQYEEEQANKSFIQKWIPGADFILQNCMKKDPSVHSENFVVDSSINNHSASINFGGNNDHQQHTTNIYYNNNNHNTTTINKNNEINNNLIINHEEQQLDTKNDDLYNPLVNPEPLEPKKEHLLGQLAATAICGNDITSSCLYVIGVCISYAGIWSPICLLFVSILLFLFRSIYAEVGSAITLNGASYTLLLNTTSKMTASLAACLTIISYVATAVVSGTSAIEYLKQIPGCENIPLIPGTIVLLGIFMILNLIGITESAAAAVFIFVTHILCLSILTVYGFLHISVVNQFDILVRNWNDMQSTFDAVGIAKAIFFGFGAAMLGVTGFESSANFIEQQKPGVFPKTLRNMWALVSFFNPILCFISLCALPMQTLTDPTQNASLLSLVGRVAAGKWLQILLSADAALVLSGGVLTAYVGIVGLIRQMALDRAFPSFFLKVNALRKTNHFIIITFFILCVSMVSILNGNIDSLAGVYTIAFLSVMMLFAMGDLLLKYKRSQLKRTKRAKKTVIIISIFGVLCALLSNILVNPEYLKYFAIYYSICAATVLIMFWRVKILKFIIYIVYSKLKDLKIGNFITKLLVKQAKEINAQSFIYFTKNDPISMLNKAILYVRDNELTDWLRIVHVFKTPKNEEEFLLKEQIIDRMRRDCQKLDEIYPRMRIDFIAIESENGFGPDVIRLIENRLGVRKNLMFISCPSHRFSHKVSDLGGLRIITNDFTYH